MLMYSLALFHIVEIPRSRILTSDYIYLLVSHLQTYFNPEALDLIRMLISGGATAELEQTLAEGVGMIPSTEFDDHSKTRDRSRVTLLPLESGKLEDYSVSI